MTGRGDEKQEDTTMIKERIPISGDLGSKVKQLMEYAGWYEGRSVDTVSYTHLDVYKRQDQSG